MRGREVRGLCPVLGHRLAGVLAQRVHHNLLEDFLDRCMVFLTVAHEHPWPHCNEFGGRLDYFGDALWHGTFPVRPYHQVVARLGSVLFAKFRELFTACIV
ncbi:hypothetical protein D3C76_1561420 [compost metagenome]